MTDCVNAGMRDLLPDLVAGSLDASASAEVRAHVAACAECTEEVALLRVVRSLRPVAVAVDVSRIVAALPDPSRPELGVPPSMTGPSLRRRSTSMVWRMAAAIGAVVIGGWSVLSLRNDGAGSSRTAQVAYGDPRMNGSGPVLGDSQRVLHLDSLLAGSSAAAQPTVSVASATDVASALPVGDLSDYTEEELQRMLDRLDRWDGATSADPVPTVPILPVSSGGTSR